MATYSTLGRDGAPTANINVPAVDVHIDLPDLAALIARMDKRDAAGGLAPVVHVAPANVSVYPEIKVTPEVRAPDVKPTFNVPVPVVNVTTPELKMSPITVDLLIPKVPFIMLTGGVYLLLAAMSYLIIAMHFPELFP